MASAVALSGWIRPKPTRSSPGSATNGHCGQIDTVVHRRHVLQLGRPVGVRDGHEGRARPHVGRQDPPVAEAVDGGHHRAAAERGSSPAVASPGGCAPGRTRLRARQCAVCSASHTRPSSSGSSLYGSGTHRPASPTCASPAWRRALRRRPSPPDPRPAATPRSPTGRTPEAAFATRPARAGRFSWVIRSRPRVQRATSGMEDGVTGAGRRPAPPGNDVPPRRPIDPRRWPTRSATDRGACRRPRKRRARRSANRRRW